MAAGREVKMASDERTGGKGEARRQREAAALRENLLKRKAQARARAAPADDGAGPSGRPPVAGRSEPSPSA